MTLTFDNFGESFDLLRYGHAGGANADGVYAPRRGVRRVLDLLERKGIVATFFLEGWNVRKNGDLAREIVSLGHEVASHGWMHENWNELEPAHERALIERTTAAITDAVGVAPRGWRSPSGLATTSTLSSIREAGYLYDSSMADDDVPYMLETGQDESEIIELPWNWPLDDAVYFGHPGTIRRPAEVIGLWTEEFDAALAFTGMFMLVCHPRYVGRPSRILALERLIDYIQAHDDIWFARCDELAAAVSATTWLPHHSAPATLDFS